jgi:signal transduction histidine kinase
MLTATVSHEMKTPLNAIIGLLSMLEKYIADEEGKRLLKVVHISSQILLYLVNDMIDMV